MKVILSDYSYHIPSSLKDMIDDITGTRVAGKTLRTNFGVEQIRTVLSYFFDRIFKQNFIKKSWNQLFFNILCRV